jgi:hypothetical protein
LSELVEVVWVLKGADGRTLTAALYRDRLSPGAVEMRVSYSADDVAWRQAFSSVDEAKRWARALCGRLSKHPNFADATGTDSCPGECDE